MGVWKLIYNTEQDVIKHLDGQHKNLYCIYGTENYLKQIYYEKIIEKLEVDKCDSFNYQEFAFSSISVDIIADSCYSLPVFAEKKCVVIKDIEIESLNKVESDKFYQLITDLPEETVLIIYQLSTQMDVKKNAKSKKFVKEIGKYGAVFNLSERASSDLVKFAKSYVKEFGISIQTDAANMLKDYCLSDMNSMINEMDKLCAYKQTGSISVADVELFVPKRIEISIYNLNKAIRRKNFTESVSILNDLKYMGNDPIMILGVLSSVYLDLLRAKLALDEGKHDSDIVNDFSYKGREFVVRNALADARNTSWQVIKKSIAILRKTDLNMKSLGFSDISDSYFLLEKAVMELLLVQAEV